MKSFILLEKILQGRNDFWKDRATPHEGTRKTKSTHRLCLCPPPRQKCWRWWCHWRGRRLPQSHRTRSQSRRLGRRIAFPLQQRQNTVLGCSYMKWSGFFLDNKVSWNTYGKCCRQNSLLYAINWKRALELRDKTYLCKTVFVWEFQKSCEIERRDALLRATAPAVSHHMQESRPRWTAAAVISAPDLDRGQWKTVMTIATRTDSAQRPTASTVKCRKNITQNSKNQREWLLTGQKGPKRLKWTRTD